MKIEKTCPKCQSVLEFEVSEPPQPPTADEIAASFQKLSVEAGKGGDVHITEQLRAWETGERHPGPEGAIALWEKCENCKPAWEKVKAGIVTQAVEGLTLDQVKEIAKKHKLYPPPDISIIGIGERKLKR